jgi:hypothetical protein
VEFEQKTQQWEEIEWSKRWKTFPHKLQMALLKYHALVLTMRFYEHLIGYFRKGDEILLDKLTRDAFKAAVVKSRRYLDPQPSRERHVSVKKEGYMMDMFQTCIYSNLISFLSDYSIQQGILCYGYYRYVKSMQKKRTTHQREDELQSLKLDYELVPGVQDDLYVQEQQERYNDATRGNKDTDGHGYGHGHDDDNSNLGHDAPNVWFGFKMMIPYKGQHQDQDNDHQAGGLLLSFIYKSSQLMVSRAIGLFMAGIGGAVGSLIRPGWGTLLGIQLGDACVGAMLEN